MPETLTSATLTGGWGHDLRPREFVSAMVRFEVALAGSQATLGLIPSAAAAAIERAATDFSPDVDRIATHGYVGGTPVIELLRQFRSHVETSSPAASQYLHRGATSQDVLDTAMVLCVAPLVTDVGSAVERGRVASVALGRQHARSPMLGRTLMQPAGVITFGFKAAQWAASLARAGERLRDAADRALCLQLAGSVGTGLAFGDAWPVLQNAVAERLDLHVVATWQSAREEWLNLLLQLGLLVGVASKIAGDVALLGQAEVGEAREPASAAGGSSAMPHKRNPVLALRIRGCWHVTNGALAGLLSTLPGEHERGLGSWQAELALVPALVEASLSAAETLALLLEGVEFDAARATRNIDETLGLVFAEAAVQELAHAVPLPDATRVVEQACADVARSGVHLRAALGVCLERSAAGVPAGQLDALLDRAFSLVPSVEAAARAGEWMLRRADNDQP